MARPRLQYIDLLKFFSILAIITLHAFQVWQDSQIMHINIYAFSEIVRFGVPVFVMISGALLLNREIEIKSFFKKKINRLVWPFLFFYVLTCLFVFLSNHTHEQTQNIFAFRWYFWMILGVYLSLPVINKYIQHSSLKEIEYFIFLFIFAAIFYQITQYFEIKQYFYLTLFLSPLGYLVLGYYLSIKNFNLSVNKVITFSIILFALSTFLKFCGHLGYIPINENFAVNQSTILSSWLDVGIFEIMQASSFLLSLTPIEETLGGEINNFFLSVLPENKEGEILKVLTKIANKSKIEKNVLHKCLTKILNMPVDDRITLNRDICEDISIVLREVFKKIKKKTKIKIYEDIKRCTQNYMDNFQKEDILKKFKVFNSNSSKALGIGNRYFENNINNGFKYINKNFQMIEEDQYEYKEIKLQKNVTLPIEMIILLRKFSMIKNLRLTINNDYFSNNDELSRSNEYLNKPKKNE